VDAHYVVEKAADEGHTYAEVRPLASASRIEELARMLGGDADSEKSRAHAEELLAGGI